MHCWEPPFVFFPFWKKGGKDLIGYKNIYNSSSNNFKIVGGSLKYNLQQRMHAFTLKETKKTSSKKMTLNQNVVHMNSAYNSMMMLWTWSPVSSPTPRMIPHLRPISISGWTRTPGYSSWRRHLLQYVSMVSLILFIKNHQHKNPNNLKRKYNTHMLKELKLVFTRHKSAKIWECMF